MGETKARFVGLWLLFFALIMVACQSNKPKKLGGEKADDLGPITGRDSFVIQYALRKTQNGNPNERSVLLKGAATNENALLRNLCGEGARQCQCSFFNEDNIDMAIKASSISINEAFNLITCEIPPNVRNNDLSRIDFVKIRALSGGKESGFIRIKNSLELRDVIGNTPVENIRKIFRYTCSLNFLEGSGIRPDSIQCRNGMQLGFLEIDSHYYLYEQLDRSSNFNEKGTNQNYPPSPPSSDSTCGLTITSIRCNNINTLRYGLSAESTTLFNVSFPLASGPEGTSFTAFAAPTDDNLNCPPGFVKINPYQAVPGSYTENTSNFINTDGRLDDWLLEPTSETIPPMLVSRNAPDTSRSCNNSTCHPPSGTVSVIQSIPYVSANTFFCAIPKELVNSL